MKQRSEKDIERMDELFREIGAGEAPIPIPLKEAKKLFSTPDPRQDECEFSEVCQKVIYPTESYARKVALSRQKKGAGKLRIYKCEECHGFHLSSYISKI